MTVKIHKFYKDDLTEIDNTIVSMTNTTGMSISHYACSVKSAEATLSFIIEGVEKYIPTIEDIQFCVVVRKKVNMTAVGPNEKTVTDVGQDIGQYQYTNAAPTVLSVLPSGFEELYNG